MWGKYFLLFSFIVISSAEIASNFYYEENCQKASGSCVLEKECTHAVDKNYRNLCPSQKSQGAVCCKNFPLEELNCFQTHNSCQDKCGGLPTLGRRGCPEGQTCCVLI